MSMSFSLKLLSWLLVMCLLAPFSATAQDAELDTHLAQAKVFLKKGWYREAVKELRRAASTPEGEKSFEAHLLLAQACYKEFDLRCALNSAGTARSLARAPQERQNSQGLLDYLQRNFGKVEFVAKGEISEGYLELEPLDPILDKDVKRYFSEKVAPLAEQRRTLPWIMYLPVIRYTLYGDEFKIESGKEIQVKADFTVENSKQKPMKAPPPPEFDGIGVAIQARLGGAFTMTDLGDLEGGASGIGGVLDLSVQKELGPVFRAGVFAKLNYDLINVNNTAATFGVVGTARLPLKGSFVFLPALGYGYGNGPVVTFEDCSAETPPPDGVETVVCGGGFEGDLQATFRTKGHGPMLRAEVAYERRSEFNVLMGHLGLQAQTLFAGLEGSGEGNYAGDTVSIPFIVGSDLVSVLPLRIELLAGINMTF